MEGYNAVSSAKHKLDTEMGDSDSYDFCRYLVDKSITTEDQTRYRAIIKNEIMSIIPAETISLDNINLIFNKKILNLLLELYDKYFFDNLLITKMKIHGCSLSICANNRCTTTAGKCRWGGWLGQKCFTIELSSKTFFSAFQETIKRTSGGLNCDDILDCLMLTFEHELIHALVMCFCPDWAYDKKYLRREGSNKYNSIPYTKGPSKWTGRASPSTGHSKTFMTILYNLFGQTEYKHGLFGTKSTKDGKKILDKIKLGDIITFWGRQRQGYRKKSIRKKLTATVIKINPKKIKAESKDEQGRTVTWTIPTGAILTINDNPTNNTNLVKPPPPPPLTSPENNSNLSLSNPPPNLVKNNLPSIPKSNNSPNKVRLIIPKTNINNPPKSVSPKTKKPRKLKIVKKISKASLKAPRTPKENKSTKKASIFDRTGKKHTSKYVKSGNCIFPFKYKGKLYEDCLDTGNGPWCPTIELKPNKTVNTWGYCLD